MLTVNTLGKMVINDFLASGTLISLDEENLLIGWGERRWRKKRCDDSLCSFYFPDFFLKGERPWFEHSSHCVMPKDRLLSLLNEKTLDKPSSMQWSSPDRQTFSDTFAGLKKDFKDQKLKKAVPYTIQQSEDPFKETHLKNSLVNLLTHSLQNPTYLYGFWDSKGGILGGTPEILFRQCHNTRYSIETVACAGTRKEGSERGTFISDPKELEEHRLVVEGITESLKSFGDVTVGEMQVVDLPTLSHLLTPITLTMSKTTDFDEIVKALHPTPALGAYPRDEGRKWLVNQNQLIPRERFGAPAGFVLNGGEAQGCYVAIRGIQWSPHRTFIGAGCGIVNDSVQENEWKEILLKLSAIRQMLAV